MNNNKTTNLSLREQALLWWDNLPETERAEYFNGYTKFTPADNHSQLTGREIQNIWAVAMNLPTPQEQVKHTAELNRNIGLDAALVVLDKELKAKEAENESLKEQLEKANKTLDSSIQTSEIAIEKVGILEEQVRVLRDALQRNLTFLADLNGSEWIEGNDPGSLDMKQRAKALQQIAYKTIN